MRSLKSLNVYFLKYKWRLLLGIIFIVVSNYFGVLAPSVIREAIDTVVLEAKQSKQFTTTAAEETFNNSFYMHILMFTGLALLFALLRGFFLYCMRQTIIVMSRHIEFDQKNELYQHLQRLDYDYYKQNNTGDIMTRISEDVSRVRMYTGPGIMYTLNLVVLSGLVIYQMFRVAPELTIYAITPLPIMLVTLFYVNRIIERKSEAIQSQLSALTTMAQETFAGIRVVKAFVEERSFINRFDIAAEEYRRRTLSMTKTDAVFFPVMVALVGLSTVLTIFIGGKQVIDGKITPGVIVEFIIYINMVTWPFAMVGWVTALIQRAAVSQERINAILHTKPSMSFGVVNKKILNGHIELKNVTYKYPNTGIVALKNVSFVLEPGQRLAVVGKTGSGKSTLAGLLTRIYDATEGDVILDNVNIKKYDEVTLRNNLAFVPQDVFLFSDTVANNIALGEKNISTSKEIATSHAIIDVSKAASLHHEIERLNHGYETVIGERGITLSGGQKQRVSIARALLRNAPVLILDDCLSAVDANTEREIFDNLSRYMKGRTTVLITHRVTAISDFDKIMVLQNGEAIEFGTHAELMEKNGIYRKMVELQSRTENLLP